MKPHKFRAVRTEVDGLSFPSRAEARRYSELRLLEKAGEIRDLELHPRFPLEVIRPSSGEVIQVGSFTPDSRYVDVRSGLRVIEDVKSAPTAAGEAYRLRKRIFEALYGVAITEVR